MLSLFEHKERMIYSTQRSRKSFSKEVVFEDDVDFLWLEKAEKSFKSKELEAPDKLD